MRIERHIQALIELLEDIRKEPNPAVIGFAYSAALVHMFHITFADDLDPGRAVKHTDFKSKERANKLKQIIPDFPDKNKLFLLWKQMEDKRNDLCYGHPAKKDVDEYISQFYKIKEILEKISKKKFEIEFLEKELKNEK